MNFAIVDIETTGGATKSSKITEIAIFKHNGFEIIDSFSTLVNPEIPIPEFISRLTGITDKMVADAPRFFEIAKKIIEFTEDCIFVAHNVGFDYGIVRHEFRLLGYDYRKPHLCTVRASRYVLPGYESYSLGKLSQSLGIELKNRHRAVGDAEATAHLFTRLFAKDQQGLRTFIQDELNPKALHPNLDLETVEEIPNKTGIYKLFNENNQLIYIGKSKQLRKRIEQHLRNVKTAKGAQMQREIARVEFELTGSELIALILEAELIKTHKPVYNRALKNTSFPYGLFYYTNQGGYKQLFIEKIDKNTEIPLTAFASKKDGTSYLQNLVNTYELCPKLCGLEKQTNNNPCFHYQIQQCQGACIQEETAESYNQRVNQLIDQLTIQDESFFLIEHGRDKREKSIVWVDNGSFKGFGYLPYFAMKHAQRTWLRYLEIHEETNDTRTILRYYLRKYPETNKVPYIG